MSVAIRLEHEVDVSRGDMLVLPTNRPQVGRSSRPTWCGCTSGPIDTQKTYILKHTTQMVRVQVDAIDSRLNLTTLENEKAEASGSTTSRACTSLAAARCTRCVQQEPRDRRVRARRLAQQHHRGRGHDPHQGRRSEARGRAQESRAGSGLKPKTEVSPRERRERLARAARRCGSRPAGSGRWSLAYALERGCSISVTPRT